MHVVCPRCGWSGNPAPSAMRKWSSIRNGEMFRRAGVPIERRTVAPAPSAVSIARTFLATTREIARAAVLVDMVLILTLLSTLNGSITRIASAPTIMAQMILFRVGLDGARIVLSLTCDSRLDVFVNGDENSLNEERAHRHGRTSVVIIAYRVHVTLRVSI